MRLGPIFAIGLLLLGTGCIQEPPIARTSPAAHPGPTAIGPTGGLSEADVTEEIDRLRAALLHEVPQHSRRTEKSDRTWIKLARTAIVAASIRIDQPQLLVVIDRNPDIQQLCIVLARPGDLPWQVIGSSRVSTSQAGRLGYFVTPMGVFPHTTEILDYRALGTFNENHIRGLGLQGMRVWDFGWQSVEKGWLANHELGEIRLLLHATDPDYLEQRLGRPASKGCIRIPGSMNRFLDLHGVLDAEYEQAARNDAQFAAVLPPERNSTSLAGNMLVIVDSRAGR